MTESEKLIQKHQAALKPHITDTSDQCDFLKSPDRWNGPRGAAPQTESERKLLEAAQRNAGRDLTFAERKQLLDRLRADMPKLKPPKKL